VLELARQGKLPGHPIGDGVSACSDSGSVKSPCADPSSKRTREVLYFTFRGG
jgi:hypothetical protein